MIMEDMISSLFLPLPFPLPGAVSLLVCKSALRYSVLESRVLAAGTHIPLGTLARGRGGTSTTERAAPGGGEGEGGERNTSGLGS